MKKKLIIFISTIILILCCSFAFVSCVKEPTKKHSHKWSTELTSDDTHHWRTCSGCKEIIDKAEHIWGDGEITEVATPEHDGVKTFTCIVKGCGKTKTENVQYIEVFTVSEEEWRDSFDKENFFKNCKITLNNLDYTDELIYVNNNVYMLYDGGFQAYETINEENNTIRTFWEDDEAGKWIYSDLPIDDCGSTDYYFMEDNFNWKGINILSTKYGDFIYNAETQSYVYNGEGIPTRFSYSDEDYIIKKVTIKFVNGKIVSLTIVGSYDNTTDKLDATTEYKFTYGGQVINLPLMENCRPYEPSSEK